VQTHGTAAGKDVKIGTVWKGDEFPVQRGTERSPGPSHHAQDGVFEDMAAAVGHDHMRKFVKSRHWKQDK
jgi:hypothetical protein